MFNSESSRSAHYEAPGAQRNPAIAFSVPVLAGQTEAVLAFAQQAYLTGAGELAASRARIGTTKEEVFSQRTPGGSTA